MAGLAVAVRWGAGGVSTPGSRWVRGVAGGLVRLKGLTESCGNAASTVEHPGETTEGGAMGGAAPRCSSCLCERSRTRSAAAAMAMPRRQRRCRGEPAAIELPDRHGGGGGCPARGKGDSVSPLCPIPKVPIAQEGGMAFWSHSCSRGRCVTGTGAASSDNHGSCFRACCTRLVPPGWDPPWGESRLPRDASKPPTIFLGDRESPHGTLSLAGSLSPGFSLRPY